MQVVTKAGLTVYIRLITVRLSFLLRTENYKHDDLLFTSVGISDYKYDKRYMHVIR